MPPIAPNSPRVVIVGGGLAGMSAAVALESAGLTVTLLESRRALGGRAGSYEDPQTGEQLDNCQHVLLGCCTNLLNFYERLNVRHLIHFERAIRFLDPEGKAHDLYALPGLPAPLHLGFSFLMFGAITFSERIAYARAMLAMLHLGKNGRKNLANISFGQWLDDHNQPASLVQKMYDPILVGALNENCRAASAEYAIQVFQDAMLAHARGYIMGVPACPLSQLYEKIPCRDVRLATRVSEINFTENRTSGVTLQSGEQLTADAVILATNYHSLERWIPKNLAASDERFSRLAEFDSVPILGVHLWFDRPVMKDSHAALITGPLQWLFRKDPRGCEIHGVISAARDWVNKPRDEYWPEFEAQLRTLLPETVNAKLLRMTPVLEKRATFSPTPGIDSIRPAQAPPPAGIQNLYLAGDYTKTGWPATMEGAVRSGYLAAEAVVRQLLPEANQKAFLVPDLPVQWIARLLGLEN